MGGKGSSGTSQTSVSVPPWISGVLKPLLQGSAQKLAGFQDQGWNVLQGVQPGGQHAGTGAQPGMSLEELAKQYPANAANSGGNGGPMAEVPGMKE